MKAIISFVLHDIDGTNGEAEHTCRQSPAQVISCANVAPKPMGNEGAGVGGKWAMRGILVVPRGQYVENEAGCDGLEAHHVEKNDEPDDCRVSLRSSFILTFLYPPEPVKVVCQVGC
jgi:hypothetical protein